MCVLQVLLKAAIKENWQLQAKEMQKISFKGNEQARKLTV
jgi:hypothetical protein